MFRIINYPVKYILKITLFRSVYTFGYYHVVPNVVISFKSKFKRLQTLRSLIYHVLNLVCFV